MSVTQFGRRSRSLAADVNIADGDTISVMHDGRAEKIRLYGIDAPEKGQAFGNRAKQFVSALAFGKDVKVGAKGQDR